MAEAEKWPDVAEWIARQIRDSRWPVGSTLPSYRDLPREAGVAEGTARKAVAHLAALGYLRVERHVGVRVLSVPPMPLPPLPPAGDPMAELARQVAEQGARLAELEAWRERVERGGPNA